MAAESPDFAMLRELGEIRGRGERRTNPQTGGGWREGGRRGRQAKEGWRQASRNGYLVHVDLAKVFQLFVEFFRELQSKHDSVLTRRMSVS